MVLVRWPNPHVHMSDTCAKGGNPVPCMTCSICCSGTTSSGSLYICSPHSAIHCGDAPYIVDMCNDNWQRTVLKHWQVLHQPNLKPCRAVFNLTDCARYICAVWSHRVHQPGCCCQLLLLLPELPGRPHACAGQDQATELAGSMTSGAC
jgi:hypothetical protein